MKYSVPQAIHRAAYDLSHDFKWCEPTTKQSLKVSGVCPSLLEFQQHVNRVFFTKKVKHISYGASYKALLAGIIIQPQVSHTFIYGRCRQHRVSVQHGLA